MQSVRVWFWFLIKSKRENISWVFPEEDYDYEEDYYDEESGSGDDMDYYDEYSGRSEDYDDYDEEQSGDSYEEYETKYYFIPYCHKHKGELWTLIRYLNFLFDPNEAKQICKRPYKLL